MYIDLKSLSIEELNELQALIRVEITSRKPEEKVIYTHDCFSSSHYHLNKYKHWSKLIDSIDNTKEDGYALIGPWLDYRKENRIPINSFVVEVCDTKIRLFQVKRDEKEELVEGSRDKMCSFIHECKKAISVRNRQK